MDRTSDGSDSTANSRHPFTETSMQNSNLVIPDDHPPRLPSSRIQEYHTPPASSAGTGSPSSSRNEFKAAGLGSGPPGAQGFTDSDPSLGARIGNLPLPIRSNNPTRPSVIVNQHQMRELAPKGPLEPMGRMLHGSDSTSGDQRNSLATFHPNEKPQIGQCTYRSEPFHREEHLGQRQIGFSMHARYSPTANPYEERADEIGPSHRIPGIVHLRGLLTPPGWKEGDEPIDPQTAEKLFHVARQEARDALDAYSEEREQLGVEESEKRNGDRESQWKLRHLLDHTLYNERVNVYTRYQHRSQLGLRPEIRQQNNFSQSSRPLETVHPTATTNVMNDIHLCPNQPNLNREPVWVNTSYSAQSRPDNRSFSNESSAAFSPSLLDPTLLPQTLENMHKRYLNNKIVIQQMIEENERNLASYIKSYGLRLSQEQLSPGALPQMTKEPARPFYSSQGGNNSFVSGDQHGRSVPRPPQYVSPIRERYGGSGNPFQYPDSPSMEPQKPGSYQPAVHGYPMPSEQTNNHTRGQERPRLTEGNGHDIQNNFITSIEEAKGSKNDPPKAKRKRVLKEKVEKAPLWYSEFLQKADWRTTSAEDMNKSAIQAGYDFDPNRPKTEKTQKQSPARRRRGAPLEFDPYVGIPISDEVANLLIANGAPERRNDPVPASAAGPQLPTGGVAGVAPVRSGLSSHTSPYNPSPAENPNVVLSRNAQPEASSDSEVSSDPSDDKDGDYGRKGKRHKISTPRSKSHSTRTTPRSSNRRKPADAAGANKRSRFGRDDPNNMPDDHADGRNGLGA